MNKIITKFLNLIQLLLACFLMFNYFHVISFTDDIRYVIMFLTLVIMIFICVLEANSSNGKFMKFLSISTLLFIVVGGVFATIENQINLVLVFCLMSTCLMGLMNVALTD